MNGQSPPRRGLGRGLGSLIPSAPTQRPATTGGPARALEAVRGPAPSRSGESAFHPATDDDGTDVVPDSDAGAAPPAGVGAYFAELPVSSVSPNPRQPRQVFDEEAMRELVHSVTEIGLLQPVVVRRTGHDAYELVMGERRWRATQLAGLEVIPAIVRETADDALLRDALLENLHRADLNPLEEAAAYSQLLEDFGCTHEELATRIGRSRPQISNTLRLLKLPAAVQRRVAAGVLSAGHARALVGIADSERQGQLAARVVAEGISVRGLEEIVALGFAHDSAQPARSTTPTDRSDLDQIARELGERLDTRVRVELGKSKGKITVEFASRADLKRIMDVLHRWPVAP